MERIQDGPMAGRTVLVTGASSGIGRATALGLARMGAHVAITGRDRGRTEVRRPGRAQHIQRGDRGRRDPDERLVRPGAGIPVVAIARWGTERVQDSGTHVR